MHDRDDKYEGSDEPEYHFSDEDGGDFVDSEIPKESTAPVIEPTSERKGLASSKRMMISLVVFLGLVYVVYKMVAPTGSQVPSTDITPPVAQAAQPPVMAAPKPAVQEAALPPQVPVVATPVVAQPSVIPVESNVPATVPIAASVEQGAAQPPTASPVPMGEQQAAMMSPQSVMPVAPQSAPSEIPASMAQQPSQLPPTSQQPPSSMPQMAVMPTVSQPPVGNLPPAMPTTQGNNFPLAQPTTPNDPRELALQTESSRLMNQMQSEYVQKLNDFSTQNKALQDQVQTLNSRMSSMETQMNQLVQALTRQNQSGSSPETISAPAAPPEPPVTLEQKLSYNVQAIIPGRAWLRSDNGETVTVAEGDVIKNLGRVMKIDPYDGVVEVNTGNKTISLSYGTG